MIYLDYSATTFVSDEVLKSFTNACKLKGNPNSNHRLGNHCYKEIENSTNEIAKLLNCDVLTEEKLILLYEYLLIITKRMICIEEDILGG